MCDQISRGFVGYPHSAPFTALVHTAPYQCRPSEYSTLRAECGDRDVGRGSSRRAELQRGDHRAIARREGLGLMLEIRILGPLEAWADGVELRLGTPKQQAVLGWRSTTASGAGRRSRRRTLAPPATGLGRRQRAHVRGQPAPAAGPGQQRARSTGPPPGRLPPGRDGRTARPAPPAPGGGPPRRPRAAGDLAGAADTSSGRTPCGAGPCSPASTHGTRTAARCQAVDDDQAAVVERLAEMRLVLGQTAEAIALLQQHLRRHPLRERGYVLLMRAQSDAGDAAEALATYQVRPRDPRRGAGRRTRRRPAPPASGATRQRPPACRRARPVVAAPRGGRLHRPRRRGASG